jgi:hypothetical protein
MIRTMLVKMRASLRKRNERPKVYERRLSGKPETVEHLKPNSFSYFMLASELILLSFGVWSCTNGREGRRSRITGRHCSGNGARI